MFNPFEEKKDDQAQDRDYIVMALGGNMAALESLVLRHQAWIYNIAFNMINDMHIAEDITQEVLIKVITKLSTYDAAKATFRTWLYRIVVNHIINLKESEKEKTITELVHNMDFNEFIARIPDPGNAPDTFNAHMEEETKISCLQCILLCLNRRDRIVFVLGAVFDVNDSTGSEICEITRDNFRKILSRSRIKVNNFFKKNCSLIDEKNPCRCRNKREELIKLDMIDTGNTAGRELKIKEMLRENVKSLEGSYYEFCALFKNQPFYKEPDMTIWLRDLMKRNDIQNILSIN